MTDPEQLRRRLYAPGASPQDALAYTKAVTPLQVAPESDSKPEDSGIEDKGLPAGRAARPTRRGLLIAAGCATTAAVALLAHPWTRPSLGRLVGDRVPWRFLGTTSTGAQLVTETRPGARSVALALQDLPATAPERAMAMHAPFFARGLGSEDFDVTGFDVGAIRVAVTVISAAAAAISVELGVLRRDDPTTAFRISGQVPAGRAVWGWSDIHVGSAPRTLRVTAPDDAAFLLRAVFIGARES